MSSRALFSCFHLAVAALLASGWTAATDACPLERSGGWGRPGSGSGEFQYAHHLCVAPSGDVYVGDLINNRVQRFSADGFFLGAWGRAEADGIGAAPDGTIYVVGDDLVTKHTSTGVLLTSWGGTGSGPGQFRFPLDVVVDAAGFVYVTELNNHRVQKFTAEGAYVTEWGGDGLADTQFQFPLGISIDPNGLLVVSDIGTQRIKFFTPEGVFVRAWGTPGTGEGEFEGPGKVAFDTDGNVLVPDGTNSRVQVYTPLGDFLCDWGSEGQGPEQLFHPTAIAAGGGQFYVMDKDNHRVVRLRHQPTTVDAVSWSWFKRRFE